MLPQAASHPRYSVFGGAWKIFNNINNKTRLLIMKKLVSTLLVMMCSLSAIIVSCKKDIEKGDCEEHYCDARLHITDADYDNAVKHDTR